MSVLRHAYQFAQLGHSPRFLRHSVRQELRVAADLLVLAETNLLWAMAHSVFVSDASSYAWGAHESRWPLTAVDGRFPGCGAAV